MATRKNPMRDSLDREEANSLFSQFSYSNFNGVRREIQVPRGGTEVAVPHGLGFKPALDRLTLRPHVMVGDTGHPYMTREPDDTNIYVSTPRGGKLWLEISHPPQGEQ